MRCSSLFTCAACFAMSSVLGSLPQARADIAQALLSGTASNGSSLSATLTLNWNNLTNQLIVALANTSNAFGVNSTVTGFGLMGGTASTASGDFSAAGTSNDAAWEAANNLSATPNGTFDFGGITGANFNGGDPNAGIDQGATGTFTFSNLSSSHTSALDFLNDANGSGFSVTFRFQSVSNSQGIGDGGSAKLTGLGGTIVTQPIPAPGAALLGAVGLFVVGAFQKKRAHV